jgi:phosphohistidine swiveling domain-containing protein
MAFIGNSILKSMVDKKMIIKEVYDSFMQSISVVKLGGHLRPGTYDITSQRYDKAKINLNQIKTQKDKVIFPDIDLKDFPISKDQLLDFIKKSIEDRETVKFEFTKNISDSIELIADLGKLMKYTREDMSNLDLDLIFWAKGKDVHRIKELWDIIINQRKKEKTIHEKLSLPPILFSENDFKIIPSYVAKPNFITQKQVEGEISIDLKNIKDKIVVIKNADPGYDWIFNEGIKGLITCYGGVASHMSIRCAELGLPSAIGCGNDLYQIIRKSSRITLNCKDNTIEVIT